MSHSVLAYIQKKYSKLTDSAMEKTNRHCTNILHLLLTRCDKRLERADFRESFSNRAAIKDEDGKKREKNGAQNLMKNQGAEKKGKKSCAVFFSVPYSFFRDGDKRGKKLEDRNRAGICHVSEYGLLVFGHSFCGSFRLIIHFGFPCGLLSRHDASSYVEKEKASLLFFCTGKRRIENRVRLL
ncbi:hypothetical protein CEXT_650491 [Caerostris extrusa]|uniref:Uncharacterized protein n=1 Tax=Caerostris extrusa TaxID=172846 RepID=A0AAV4MXJ4_CAEEX|nr:hypothetical protein CEXT_650491 [Caerostris extrusa]